MVFTWQVLVFTICACVCLAVSPLDNEVNGFHQAADEASRELDQQGSAQNYRPYGNNRRPIYPANNYVNNRRPIYPTSYYGNYRRPSYPTNFGNNRRPPLNSINNNRPATTGYPAASATNNRRPAPPTEPTSNRPCNSTDDATQQDGICWDANNQLLRTSSNLMIEKFVAFYSKYFGTKLSDTSRFRSQICDQSRRFNSVGVLCVSTGEDDCMLNGSASAQSCINYDCICVVGERYQKIAKENTHFFSSYFSSYMASIFYPGFPF